MIGRRWAGLLLILACLLLVLAISPVLLDLNRHKPELAAWLKTRIGSDIELGGDIEWTLFPDLSISAKSITVAGPTGFQGQPLLAVGRTGITLGGLSLLRGKLSIKRLIIDGFELNLIENKHGVSNWQNLTGSKALPERGRLQGGHNSFDNVISMAASVDEVMVTNGQITWDNRRTGEMYFFKDGKVKINKTAGANRFKIELESDISKPSNPLPGSVKLTTGMYYDSLQTRLKFNGSRLNLSGFESLFPYRLPDFSIIAGESSFDWPGKSLQMTGIELETNQVKMAVKELSMEHLLTQPKLQASAEISTFNPGALLKELDIDVANNLWINNNVSSAAAVFKVQASPDKLEVPELKLSLDDIQADGSMAIENFEHPKFNFNLAIDNLNLDRYWPTLKNASGPGSTIARLSDTLRLKLPVTKIKALTANGELNVKRLTSGGIAYNDVRLRVQSK